MYVVVVKRQSYNAQYLDNATIQDSGLMQLVLLLMPNKAGSTSLALIYT